MNDVYEVKWLGLGYNSNLRDNTFNIQIDGDGIFKHSESLVFEVRGDFDILTRDRVTCNHDTLTINFSPKQRVYFKNINKFAVCFNGKVYDRLTEVNQALKGLDNQIEKLNHR